MSKRFPWFLSVSQLLMFTGNIRILGVSGLLTGTYTSMLNTTLQPFTLSLGLSLTALGIFQALGNRLGGLSGSIIQPIGGYLADVYGRKAMVLVGSLVAISSMSSFLVAAITQSWFVLIPAYLLYGFSLLSTPANQAIIAESVELKSESMRVAYSTVFLFTSIPGAVMAFAGGLIADTVGYYLVFLTAVCLELFNFALYLFALKETNVLSNNTRNRLLNHRVAFLQTLRNLLIPPRGLRGFFATFAVDAISFAISGNIIYGMIVRQFHFSTTDVGVIVGVLSITLAMGQIPATKLMLKYGSKKSLALSEGLSVVLMLGWNFSNSVLAFAILSILFGISIVAWVPAQETMVMTVASENERGALAGRLAAFRGILAFPGPILGGILFDSFGYSAPLVVSAVGVACALIMILRILPDEKPVAANKPN